jgi:thiamine-phosphate pyrophosphorylase
VVDREAAGPGLDRAVYAAVAAGVDVVQIRERRLDGARLLAHAREVADAARDAARDSGRSVRIVVNRRVDIALAIGADGVHLGFDAMEIATARKLLGRQAWIGSSAHSVAEVAAAAGADYAHLAPICAPLSKRGTRPPLGNAAITAAARSGARVFAQGGVTPDNAGELCRAGAIGVAVTGAILLADDVSEATRALRAAIDRAGPSPTRRPR